MSSGEPLKVRFVFDRVSLKGAGVELGCHLIYDYAGEAHRQDFDKMYVTDGDTLTVNFDINDISYEVAEQIYQTHIKRILASPGGRID